MSCRPLLMVTLLVLAAVVNGCTNEKPLPVRGDFETIENIDYAAYGERTLKLDLYLPDDPVAVPMPVVIAVRGGGFRRGDKAGFGPIAGGLADRGIAAASIEYRTSAEAQFPGAIADTKAAVRWLRTNAASYGLDPDAIGVIGGSAGGYLAAYLGVTRELSAVEGDGGNSGVSSQVQAVVAMAPESGPSELSAWPPFLGETNGRDEAKRERASALTHIDFADEPPLLLIHSDGDSVVPFSESERLFDAYVESNNQAELITLGGAPHAFWYDAFWFPIIMDDAADFFAVELAGVERASQLTD